MKIYQIRKINWVNDETFPVIYNNTDGYETYVDDRIKDFIKLSDGVYAAFLTLFGRGNFVIAKIPDDRMYEGELEYFTMEGIDKFGYIALCKEQVVPVYKKIQFKEMMTNL